MQENLPNVSSGKSNLPGLILKLLTWITLAFFFWLLYLDVFGIVTAGNDGINSLLAVLGIIASIVSLSSKQEWLKGALLTGTFLLLAKLNHNLVGSINPAIIREMYAKADSRQKARFAGRPARETDNVRDSLIGEIVKEYWVADLYSGPIYRSLLKTYCQKYVDAAPPPEEPVREITPMHLTNLIHQLPEEGNEATVKSFMYDNDIDSSATIYKLSNTGNRMGKGEFVTYLRNMVINGMMRPPEFGTISNIVRHPVTGRIIEIEFI